MAAVVTSKQMCVQRSRPFEGLYFHSEGVSFEMHVPPPLSFQKCFPKMTIS